MKGQRAPISMDHTYQPKMVMGEAGHEVAIAIPVTRREVVDRVNKALADDRQRLMFDGNRVVWVDLRAAKEIDLEEYARRHGHMAQAETFTGE